MPGDAPPAGPTRPPLALVEAGSGPLSPRAGQQGRPATFDLLPQCAGVGLATADGADGPLLDVDQDPDTFTIDTGVLDLGTYLVSFDCGETTAAAKLFVYRQNGAQRGGANSIVTIAGLALAGGVGLVTVPSLAPLVVPFVDERRRAVLARRAGPVTRR
ncbi:MAG: hypothetical protein ACFCVK_08365 [Acidimicrobiales bacterium]